MEEIIAVPQVTQKLLKKHRISLTKGLGQNFLVDRGIVDEIVLAGEIDDDDNIIEIGLE